MHLQNRIIAEIGSVHDGSFGNAIKLIELAKECGADAAKFQLHLAKFESIKDAPNPYFFKDESRFEYFERTSFTSLQWQQIANFCKSIDMDFICSPFSVEALDILLDIGVDAIKIASGELTNLDLIEKSVHSGKTVYISTGMSNYLEIESAVDIIQKSKKNNKVVLMQCTSLYPCPPEFAGVNIINEYHSRFGLPVGFSDHTNTNSAAIIAAYLGANHIEKHITFSNFMYGSDAKFAYTPDKFKSYVEEVKSSWVLRDNPVDKNNINNLIENRMVFQKSLTLSRDLKKGSIISRDDLVLKKPGLGLSYSSLANLIGKRVSRDLKIDYQIKFEDLE
jgi:N,N'-diacetyllegionaminate synthase